MHPQPGSGRAQRGAPGASTFLSQALVDTHAPPGILGGGTGPFSNYVEFLRIPAKS